MMVRSRRTVRMRLTALYCVLFVLSAVVLLAITNGVGSSTSQTTTVTSGGAQQGRTVAVQAQTATSHQYLLERLAIDGPGDELKDLADTIDALLERLDGAFAAQRRFVANSSHELRTPLAAMRVSVDVAVAKPGPVPPGTITLAGQVRAELDKVDQLLEGLLVLARAQHGA